MMMLKWFQNPLYLKVANTISLTPKSPSLRVRKSVTRDETLKAEILWALKVTMSHYSCKSCEGTSKLLQAMFNS